VEKKGGVSKKTFFSSYMQFPSFVRYTYVTKEVYCPYCYYICLWPIIEDV